MSWAGLYNTEFWIDPQRHIGGVLLMQMLPFYDDGAIRTLREFEAAVYRQRSLATSRRSRPSSASAFSADIT